MISIQKVLCLTRLFRSMTSYASKIIVPVDSLLEHTVLSMKYCTLY